MTAGAIAPPGSGEARRVRPQTGGVNTHDDVSAHPAPEPKSYRRLPLHHAGDPRIAHRVSGGGAGGRGAAGQPGSTGKQSLPLRGAGPAAARDLSSSAAAAGDPAAAI